MVAEPRDEGTHRAGAHPFWNESFYFNFFDAEGGYGGATRIGFSPNRAHRDGFVCFYFPDGEVGFVRTNAPLAPAEHGLDGQPIACGPLVFVCERPFERWRASYRGPIFVADDPMAFGDLMRVACVDLPRRDVEIELVFESVHEPFDFHPTSRKGLLAPSRWGSELARRSPVLAAGVALHALSSLPAMMGATHYEQAVEVSGRIRIDGRERTFRGMGQRDHSYGVRDMRVPTRWRWVSCQMGRELCFNVTRVEVLGLEVTGGYAFVDGRPVGLVASALEGDVDARGRLPESMGLALSLPDGRDLAIPIRILRQLPIAIETEGRGAVVNETLARFELGGRSAIGIVEAMERRFS